MISLRSGLLRVPCVRIPTQITLQSLVKSTSSSSPFSAPTQSRTAEEPKSAKFVPLKLKLRKESASGNIGEELTGRKLTRLETLKLLNKFYQRPHIKKLASDIGIDSGLYEQAFKSFQEFCVKTDPLPAELHVIFVDILNGGGHVDDLYQPFVKFAREIFPHLDCIDELKKISDLRLPPNWYPEARAEKRKIVFHCGPTNSGKTYNALKRFMTASSGIYCGPLKLLAMEVFAKANERGTLCDLVTGEERRIVKPDGEPSEHVACTVEMVSTKDPCEVAVIDEIQMVRDHQRGWAWTRALLGVPAKEVHICGEEAALDVIKEILLPIGEEIEVQRYERLTNLIVQESPIISLENIRDGDCIVCFNKMELFSLVLELERMGKEVGLIYGSLPPSTKLAQARKFNDPDSKCKILVATDAIGMGLNLSIKRIVFNSLKKMELDENGEKMKNLISVSQALQIAGRAGRYNSAYESGYVTTMKKDDLPILKKLLNTPVDPIAAVGLQPTADQIELFAYYLPQASLSNLMDIFVSLCEINSFNYFMCDIAPFKALADMIQHISLPLRARYVFCCAPINQDDPFVCSMFTQFARKYSVNEPVTIDWLCESIGWPLPPPRKLANLQHLEMVFDVLELYLWLSYRFPDLFPDGEMIRKVQAELDTIIDRGLFNIVKLIRGAFEAPEKVDRYKYKAIRSRSKHNQASPSSPPSDIRVDEILRFCPAATKSLDLPASKSLDEDKSSAQDGSQDSGTSLTQQLIDSGLLTSDMVRKLHKEWSKKNDKTPNKSKKKTDSD